MLGTWGPILGRTAFMVQWITWTLFHPSFGEVWIFVGAPWWANDEECLYSNFLHQITSKISNWGLNMIEHSVNTAFWQELNGFRMISMSIFPHHLLDHSPPCVKAQAYDNKFLRSVSRRVLGIPEICWDETCWGFMVPDELGNSLGRG